MEAALPSTCEFTVNMRCRIVTYQYYLPYLWQRLFSTRRLTSVQQTNLPPARRMYQTLTTKGTALVELVDSLLRIYTNIFTTAALHAVSHERHISTSSP